MRYEKLNTEAQKKIELGFEKGVSVNVTQFPKTTINSTFFI